MSKSQISISPSNTYKLFDKKSGQVMSVQDGSTKPGSKVVQWPDKGNPDQKWTLEKVDGGGEYLNFLNEHSGLYLSVPHSSTEKGICLNIDTLDTNREDQQWRLVDIGGEVMQIVNKKSGLVVAVQDSSTEPGICLVQWPYTGGGDQKWTKEPTTETSA